MLIYLITDWSGSVVKENIVVEIKASRVKDELVYSVDCSSEITNEELEYFLEEIIKGICEWKPGICTETVQNFNGIIKKKKRQT
jgi:hypothetical protein